MMNPKKAWERFSGIPINYQWLPIFCEIKSKLSSLAFKSLSLPFSLSLIKSHIMSSLTERFAWGDTEASSRQPQE